MYFLILIHTAVPASEHRIGPTFFIVTASDLQPVHAGKVILKLADDTYVILPAVNLDSSTSKLMHIQSWAKDNNKLNCC